MARKLKPHEELAFLEAAATSGHALGGETCPACQLRRAMDQSHFDKHPLGPSQVEFLLGEEIGPDEWF